MSQESTIYLVNLIIGTMLAVLMTQHLRRDGHAHGLRFWTIAAWVLAAADLLFALRPVLPFWAGRLFPTLMVTVGHGALFIAASETAGSPQRWRTVGAFTVAHGLALGAFLAFAPESSWRTVVNGVTWGALSIAAGAAIWRGPVRVRSAFAIPSIVFAWQGIFHAFRSAFATRAAVQSETGSYALVQLLGDLEVSLFMVALFVSVLAAHLRDALTRVRELSSLLPLCAWCGKVRGEDGTWSQMEQYLATKAITITHGMCDSCEAREERGERRR